MRLEAITAEVRPRNQWEAVDLGWALTRSLYPRILRAMMVLVWPVWALVLVLCADQLLWGMVLIWWTKPLVERVPLYLISRELFGEAVSAGGLWRRFYHVWVRHLFFALVPGRFSPVRSTVAPVRELEKLRGRSYMSRAESIALRCGGVSWWTQIVHLILLHSLSISALVLVYLMIPQRFAPDLELWFAEDFKSEVAMPLWFRWTWAGLYLLALTLVTPLYAGAGFGLYLNARTRLEGWDIELAFRRMTARLQKGALAAGLVAASLVWLGGGSEARAQDAAAPGEAPGSPAVLMEEILAAPEFEIHTRTEYRPVEFEGPGWSLFDWFPSLGLLGWAGWLADILIWGMIGLVATVVGIFIYRFVRALPERDGGDKPADTVKTVAGLNVERKSLPRDVVKAARELWKREEGEEAVALLYRAAISAFIHEDKLPIRESDTEADCLETVRQRQLPEMSYFEALTRVRVATAYGKRGTDADAMEPLLSQWPFTAGRAGVPVE